MAEQFKGTINVDIRDSEPDWSPFEPPKAPEGAPNVVYIVLDDVGFSAMGSYGGPTKTSALKANSPAIDEADCPNPLPVDQRGETRDDADIGAYER